MWLITDHLIDDIYDHPLTEEYMSILSIHQQSLHGTYDHPQVETNEFPHSSHLFGGNSRGFSAAHVYERSASLQGARPVDDAVSQVDWDRETTIKYKKSPMDII